MRARTSLLLNARFVDREMSGVERVAHELTRALVALLAELGDAAPALRLAAPRGARLVAPYDQLEVVHRGALSGYAWEQSELAVARPSDWLLNLCNVGPALRRRQLVVMHDAQVFDAPESYRGLFRATYRTLTPIIARRSAVLATVSEHARRRLEHHGAAPPNKAWVIPNGADHILRAAPDESVLHRRGLRPQGYLLAVASSAPHKNLATAIAAVEARTGDAPPLALVGGADPRVFAASAGAGSSVIRRLGRVSDAELRALYENALALVFPSLTEGFGLPAVEAMLCGCPVIATTGGAVPEVCGDAAVFVEPRDTAGWTGAVERLTGDASLRAELSDAGRVHAAQYTWRRAAARLVSAIAAAAGDRALASRVAQAAPGGIRSAPP